MPELIERDTTTAEAIMARSEGRLIPDVALDIAKALAAEREQIVAAYEAHTFRWDEHAKDDVYRERCRCGQDLRSRVHLRADESKAQRLAGIRLGGADV